MRSVAASPNGIASPEVRWWFSRFAVPLLPIGLQLAAWTSDADTFWIVPLIGFAMFGFAFFSVIVSIFAYMMDSYKSFSVSLRASEESGMGRRKLIFFLDSYQASAMSGVVLSRNLVCAFLPLGMSPSAGKSSCIRLTTRRSTAARPMFKTLGNNWALFTLSLVSCLLVPIPWFLYYKGKAIRQKSPFCRQHMED